MRHAICLLALVFGTLTVSGAQSPTTELEKLLPPEVVAYGFADLVLLNGKIVSMDDAGNNENPGTTYQAMAVKNDRIMALGASADIRRLASSATRVVDLQGKTVIPGIVETHSHIYGVERWAKDLDIPLPYQIAIPEGDTITDTRENIAKAIRSATQQVKPGQWIVAGMAPNPRTGARNSIYWARDPKQMVHREFLDAVSRANPVLVRSATRGFINTAALKQANEYMPGFTEFIQESMEDEAGDTGHLGSQEMASLTWEIFLHGQPTTKLAEGIRRNLEMRAAVGWTTFSTRIPMPGIMSAFVYLDRTRQMPIRLAGHFETHRRAAPPAFTKAFYQQTGNLTGMGGDFFWLSGVASERWDSLGPDACLGPDFPAAPEIKKRERCPNPGTLWWDVLKTATTAGWRPAGVHGVGSHAVRLFLDMLDEVVKEQGWTAEDVRKLRPTLEHGMVFGTKPETLKKLRDYGVIVSFGPGFIAQGERLMRDYGPGLEQFIVPVKTVMDAGVRVVGQLEGSPSVGYHLWTLMTRRVGKSTVNEKEAIDRVRALKMWTRWAAEYVYKENDLGSLEKGKWADFVVLDRDYFQVPLDDIRAIVPLMTVVGGKTRFLHRTFAQDLGLSPIGYQSENPRPWDADPRAEADMAGR